MYADRIREKFPEDPQSGLYKAPRLPALKLGKLLMRDRRVASPTDVLALHLDEGTFSTQALIFTKTDCLYEGGAFPLSQVREARAAGRKLSVVVNQNGQLITHSFSVKNEPVAQLLRRLLEDFGRYDPEAEAVPDRSYEGLDPAAVPWLLIRDEVMRTIDMLYERYNDGKISLLEYEEKKQALLDRL